MAYFERKLNNSCQPVIIDGTRFHAVTARGVGSPERNEPSRIRQCVWTAATRTRDNGILSGNCSHAPRYAARPGRASAAFFPRDCRDARTSGRICRRDVSAGGGNWTAVDAACMRDATDRRTDTSGVRRGTRSAARPIGCPCRRPSDRRTATHLYCK